MSVSSMSLPESPADIDHGLRRAEQLGLVDHIERGRAAGGGRWAVTEVGRDWCEGRVEIGGRAPEARIERRGRGKIRPRATWLRALPRPGQVRMVAQ